MELKGIPYLKGKLMAKAPRNIERYRYYEMKNLAFDFGISTPPDLRYWNAVLGWCAKGVDALADRLDFYEFRNDDFGLNTIYDLNNRDTLIPSAILSALITACSFIYISEDETGFPRLQVIDGMNATGVLDPVTQMLTEGYAILERGLYGQPTREAYFTADFTAYYENGQLVDSRVNRAGHPLLVPMIFRPDAVRPFGHSRISRSCMSLVGSALRTVKRSEISAEFYSFPQKWATGLDQQAEQSIEKWQAAMSTLFTTTLSEDGTDHVKLGQFSQQSMEPHLSQLRMFASLFAGETGLTLDDLGFPSDNPSSAEAIKAAHENLRLTASHAHKSFGVGLLNAGFLAACLRDDVKYLRYQLYRTKPTWYPAFLADASTLGVVGDGLAKIAQSFPDYITPETIFDLTGV